MKGKKQIGKALGRVPSGLFVVTAKHDEREDAVLASWVNQCSFEPPTLSIVLATVRPARLLVEASGGFIVNVLGKESKALLKHFFKREITKQAQQSQQIPASTFTGCN